MGLCERFGWDRGAHATWAHVGRWLAGEEAALREREARVRADSAMLRNAMVRRPSRPCRASRLRGAPGARAGRALRAAGAVQVAAQLPEEQRELDGELTQRQRWAIREAQRAASLVIQRRVRGILGRVRALRQRAEASAFAATVAQAQAAAAAREIGAPGSPPVGRSTAAAAGALSVARRAAGHEAEVSYVQRRFVTSVTRALEAPAVAADTLEVGPPTGKRQEAVGYRQQAIGCRQEAKALGNRQ